MASTDAELELDQAQHDYAQVFAQHYAIAMLWANAHTLRRDDDGDVIRTPDYPDGEVISFGDADIQPADWQDSSDTWAISAFDSAAQASIWEDCTAFVRDNWADLGTLDPAQCGHDFALTRNHHGAGFWDRGLGDAGRRLTDASHAYGDSTASWAGEDGHPVTLD
jgi:hypothetical protein